MLQMLSNKDSFKYTFNTCMIEKFKALNVCISKHHTLYSGRHTKPLLTKLFVASLPLRHTLSCKCPLMSSSPIWLSKRPKGPFSWKLFNSNILQPWPLGLQGHAE